MLCVFEFMHMVCLAEPFNFTNECVNCIYVSLFANSTPNMSIFFISVCTWCVNVIVLFFSFLPSVRRCSVPQTVASSKPSDYSCLLHRQINPLNNNNPFQPISPSLPLLLCQSLVPPSYIILKITPNYLDRKYTFP